MLASPLHLNLQPELDDVRQRLKKVQDTLELDGLDAATLTSLTARESRLYAEKESLMVRMYGPLPTTPVPVPFPPGNFIPSPQVLPN